MTVCTAETRAGRPCRAHAVRGSDPPRCYVHGGLPQEPAKPQPPAEEDEAAPDEGHLSIEKLADLVARATDETLEDEIAAARQATESVLAKLQKDVEKAEYARLARLVFTGANTIARLLTTQRALSGDSADGMARSIAQALDELGREMGVEL